MHRRRKIYPALLTLAISFGATLTSAKSEIPDPNKTLLENVDIAVKAIKNPDAPLEEATEAAIFLGERAEEAEDSPTDSLSHKIIDALRYSLNDDRPEIRDPAASSLASNSDIIALETLQKNHKDNKISDMEFILYVTSSPPKAGASFVNDLLDKKNVSDDVQRLALGYLRGAYTSPNKDPDLPTLSLVVTNMLEGKDKNTASPQRPPPPSPFPN